MVRASQLARADDAGDARRDLLWPELAANLLPRRSAGVRRPHGAVRYLGRACDADSGESRWHCGDDRDRNAAELDQHQTQAASVQRTLRSARVSTKDEQCRHRPDRRQPTALTALSLCARGMAAVSLVLWPNRSNSARSQ